MIKINLVGEGRKPVVARASTRQRKLPAVQGEQVPFILLVGCVVIGAIVVALWFLRLNAEIKENDQRIAEARQRVEELRDILRQVEEFEAKEALLTRKIEVITTLKNSQRGPVELMDEISKALPDLLWVDRLVQSGSQITLTGRSFNTSAIASFVENLDLVETISEPEVRDIVNQGEVYSFTVIFTKTVPVPTEGAEQPSAAA